MTEAIKNNDQVAATDEKTVVEQAQRVKVKARIESGGDYKPFLFEMDHNSGSWIYKHAE